MPAIFATVPQLEALNQFFRTQPFGRFAVTMTHKTELPEQIKPIQVPGLLRRRWAALTPRFKPLPVEVAFIHEASERGDELLERYFSPSIVTIDGKPVAVHHGIMPKGDEALEVADFCRPGGRRPGEARHPARSPRPPGLRGRVSRESSLVEFLRLLTSNDPRLEDTGNQWSTNARTGAEHSK